jgi:gamma-glutamyl hercynylcysteine S-oxide synthase
MAEGGVDTRVAVPREAAALHDGAPGATWQGPTSDRDAFPSSEGGLALTPTHAVTPIPARRAAPTGAQALDWLADATLRTRELLADFQGTDWLGPKDPLLNPPLWELGHLAWFAERWLLRGAGTVTGKPLGPEGSSLVENADGLYNSATVAHKLRWDLPLLPPARAWQYVDAVNAGIAQRVASEPFEGDLAYFVQLCAFHQDMHNEATVIYRQFVGREATACCATPPLVAGVAGDVEVSGGLVNVGTLADHFAFCNEQGAHAREVAPFRMAARPVTAGEYAKYVEATGHAPLHWQREGTQWQERWFGRWQPIAPDAPMMHVSAHDAENYCRWAGRRLPTEFEWEAAAQHGLANTGLVWEWTASTFAPYDGFRAGPYKEYSEPWFNGHYRVLKGGAWFTPRRMLAHAFRNFYTQSRRDMFCGFRTCAVG